MKVFAEIYLAAFLDARLQTVAHEVASEESNRLLNMNETQYITYLAEKCQHLLK